MNITLIPPSNKELEEAIDYYNDQMPGLGQRFYNTFLNTVNYISIAPDVWRKVGDNTRKIVTTQESVDVIPAEAGIHRC